MPTPSAKEPKHLVTNAKPPTPPPTVAAIDPEFEKRQKRAERFGIPFIELKKNPSPAEVRLFPLCTNYLIMFLFLVSAAS